MATGTAQASWNCTNGNWMYGPSWYCENIGGGGLYVTYVEGYFGGSAFACNYYETAEFYDTSWNWYQTLRSSTRWGCATGDQIYIWTNSYKRAGYACSTLHYANTNTSPNRTMRVCRTIHS